MKLLKAEPQFVGFAPIDLKDAYFYAYDGFRVTGVTNTDTEPASETVIALTGCTSSVPVGCAVQFANDSTETEYVVASRVTSGGTNEVQQVDLDGATGGTFTMTYNGQDTNAIAYDASNATIQLELEALDGIGNGDVAVAAGDGSYEFKITFQDDLASTPIGSTIFTFDKTNLTGGGGSAVKDVTTPGVVDGTTDSITLEEGLAEEVASGGAVTFNGRRLEVKIGEGNFVYNEIRNREYLKDRGTLDTVRDADEEPMEVDFEFTWEWIGGVTGSGIPTIEDVLKQQGEASAWETTSSDPCEPYCVDLKIWYDPNCGGDNSERITLLYFRYESLNHNARDAQISCSGKCNVTEATSDRI